MNNRRQKPTLILLNPEDKLTVQEVAAKCEAASGHKWTPLELEEAETEQLLLQYLHLGRK